METAIYEIKLKDGRKWRVFCANKTQKEKLIMSLLKIKPLIESWEVIVNGIHTLKQWNEQIKHIK